MTEHDFVVGRPAPGRPRSRKSPGPGNDVPDVRAGREKLLETLCQENVCAVVGTGISVAATRVVPQRESKRGSCANWAGLLRHGVERCMQLGQSQQWAEDRYGEIGSGDAEQMIDAATEIVKALKARGDDAFADWLKDSVGGLRVTSPDVPKALLDLDVPVVTTNYDTLLEQAKKARLGGPHRPPATWLEHYRVLEVLRRREDSVAHLHGCWKDPLSVVLDRESYAKIGKHEGFQYIAQAAWGLLPLLFVGVGEGMGDPNFRRLWSAIGEVWGKRDIGSRFWLRCEYERSWSAAQEESLSDRVQVVEYGPKYDSLAGFLEDLGEKRRARVEQARLVMDQLGDRPVDVAARCVVAVRRFNDEIVARLVKGHLGPVAKVPTAAHVARALGSLVAPLKEHERRHRRTASSAKRPPSTWEWSSDYVRGKLEEAMLP